MKTPKCLALFTLMLTFASLANAQASLECGLYQRLNLNNGQSSVTLTDYQSAPLQGIEYTILNPQNAIIKDMISGYCYCVEGAYTQNGNYPNDSFFRWLTVEAFVKGPYFDCQPAY